MRTFELDVQKVKLRILGLAEQEGLDSAIVVAAMADVLGLVAATLDARSIVGPVPFAQRMASFHERAERGYRRTRDRLPKGAAAGLRA
jgi:hypothetical protein